MTRPPSNRNFSRTDVGVAVVFTTISIALLASGRRDYPDLHTMLDTAMLLLSGVLAWFMWEAGTRTGQSFPRWIAVSFAITSVSELMHVLVSVEWSGALSAIAASEDVLRPALTPVGTYVLPIGVAGAILMGRRDHRHTLGFALALFVFSAALVAVFSRLPPYSHPMWLGVTRPFLIPAPFLWLAVGLACWRLRSADRLLPAMVPMALVLVAAHIPWLYSRAPHDTEAVVGHLGRVSAYLILLLSLMRMASSDMIERIRAEEALAQLNRELEERVQDRTEQLASANSSLNAEVDVRRLTETKLQAQLGRLNLLQQITRAIGERQDLRSIFQVVVRRVEDDMPADFSCICTYDPADQSLEVAGVGVKSETLAAQLAIGEHALFSIDTNGLARCVRGELIYEPDIATSQHPFPRRLAGAGLRSLVMAPLVLESNVFGVLVAARREAEGFTSGQCEFLRQLSEHTALATHHAQMYSALERAYDDLRQTQQAVMQQERLRALGQMASGIAHDINNAILPVALYADLLGREKALRPEARKYLEIIRRAVSDVGHTVRRLTQFYSERESQLELVPIQVNELLDQVVDLTRARWSDIPLQRGVVIHVTTQLAHDASRVLGVESEIREALINLIFNAVDAMPEGGTLTLRTREFSRNLPGLPPLREVSIEVADTGIGMDEETRRRCLEPFFTTKGERGTGLGLAMVFGIAKRQNAQLEIDSAPGQGTTIRLIFNVPVTAAGDLTGVLKEQPAPPPQNVLLIDDDPLVLNALQDTLEADGHVVATANGGQQGIDVFRAAKSRDQMFSLVITDLGMPYVGGREVASAIKESSPSTHVILLTGWGQRLQAEGELPPNVDCVLSKPPTLTQLRAAIAQLVGR